MNYVEYNPTNPSPYKNYVSEVERKQSKVLLIVMGTGLLIGIGYLLYKHFQELNRFENDG